MFPSIVLLVWMSTHPSSHLFITSPVSSPIHPPLRLPSYLVTQADVSNCSPTHLPVQPSICMLGVHPSVRPFSTYPSVFLCTCPRICLFLCPACPFCPSMYHQPSFYKHPEKLLGYRPCAGPCGGEKTVLPLSIVCIPQKGRPGLVTLSRAPHNRDLLLGLPSTDPLGVGLGAAGADPSQT